MTDFKDYGNGLLPYLDIPFQHAHPNVLKRMKRPASGEKVLERIIQWREVCPDLVIRSTFIAGFPGETRAEFDYLLDFMNQSQIDRVGCFAYSPVEGASANLLDGALDQAEREARQGEFMATAQALSSGLLERRVGQRIRVLVDSQNKQGGIGRSYADAPEIDGVVYIEPVDRPSKRYRVGDLIRATVLSTRGHDLIVRI
jgi:ribosomal protein S12 methylthiotransferase